MGKAATKAEVYVLQPVVESKSKKPENAPPRAFRYTTTVVTHHLPELLPFGDTTLKIVGNRWTMKCGRYELAGYDGDVDTITKCFVKHVMSSVTEVSNEVNRDEFTTTESYDKVQDPEESFN